MRLRRRFVVPVLLALPFTVLAAWPTNSTEDLVVARMAAPTIDGLLADKDGGVAVLFEDAVTAQGIDLFVEQVTADGTRVLNTATDGGFRGKSLVGAVNDQRGQQLVTDGAGGFYALWNEGFTQLRAARFPGDGTPA